MIDLSNAIIGPPVKLPPGLKAHGRRRPVPGQMNKTEQAYAAHLDLLRHAGEIQWWGFEAVKLKLAAATFYTPDFVVIRADLGIEVHETKGHFEDDARVKWKVAVKEFWWIQFVLVKKQGKVFQLEKMS